MKSIYISDLKSGMHLAKPIYSIEGELLLENGTVLNDNTINKIKKTGISAVYVYDAVKISSHSKREIVNIMDKHFNEYLVEGNFSKRKGVIPEKSFEKIKKVVSEIFILIQNNENLLLNINKIMEKDFYTYEHSINVCILSILVANELRVNDEIIFEIGLGALLHDIGKITITDAILNKTGSLNKNEYELIKNHSMFGYDFIKDNNEIPDLAKEIILYHHERIDGSGYPEGINLLNIPNGKYIAIVSLVDVFDAMTNDRIYKTKMPVYMALEFVSSQVPNVLYHRAFRALKRKISPYPVGTCIKLTTGEIGVVIKNSYNRPTRPTIRIIFDKYGNKVKKYLELDLMKELTKFIQDKCIL